MTFWRGRSGLVLGFVSILYAVGVAGHLLPFFLPWMLLMTPWFLVGAGALVAAAASKGADPGSLLGWFVPVLVVTFGLEALGVATGAVFGAYHYTETLGTLLAGVPPVIGWNWVLVVWGLHTAVARLLPTLPEAARVAVVGFACVAFDLLLEPVAIGLGYWVWHGGSVPLQNYLTWGLIGAAGSWWAGRFAKLPTDPLLGAYVLLQAVFFAVLGATGVRV